MGNRMTLVLAQDLFEKSLPGDEPEPLLVSWHSFEELLALQAAGRLCEGYAVAAMFLARERVAGARAP
jgi:ADP-ribose diphosphatase